MNSENYILQLYGVKDFASLSKKIDKDHASLMFRIEKHQRKNDKHPPVRQHVNPVHSLTRFSDNGQILRISKSSTNLVNVTDATVIKNFYNAPILYEDKFAIERFFSSIEAPAKTTLDIFAESDQINISEKERRIVCEFIALQFARTKEMRELCKMIAYQSFSNFAKERLAQGGIITQDKTDQLALLKILEGWILNPSDHISFENDFLSFYPLRHLTLITKDLMSRSILVVEFQRKRVITSANPVVVLDSNWKYNPGQFINSNVLYPISRDRIMIFRSRNSFSESRYTKIGSGSTFIAKEFNRFLLAGSSDGVFYTHPDDTKVLSYLPIPEMEPKRIS